MGEKRGCLTSRPSHLTYKKKCAISQNRFKYSQNLVFGMTSPGFGWGGFFFGGEQVPFIPAALQENFT
jgi:hypothetical protein